MRERIGFVFQDPASSFNPLLTIADGVAEPLVVHGGPRPAAARARVDELLEAVQLPEASATGSRTSSPAASGSAPAWPARWR